MAQDAKKIDWSAVLRIIIMVLTAIAEVISEDSDEKSEDKKKVDERE